MKNHSVLKSAMLLTMSGIIAKSVDFIFRAFYSSRLGYEGMGLFSLVFGFHSIMLTFATAGLGVAVSTIVAKQNINQNLTGIKRTMKIAVTAVIILSITVIFLANMFSDSIAGVFLRDGRCSLSIRLLAPSIMFMGISYCIKGYFYAMRRVLIPASSEFLEQLVKIVIIIYLLSITKNSPVEIRCGYTFLGITIGEFSSCLYLSILYIRDSKHLKGGNRESHLGLLMLKIAFPSMVSSLVGSFLRMQEDIWIIAGLNKCNGVKELALGTYGMINGMVMPLLVFPLTLLSSFSALLIPEISKAGSMRSNERLCSLVERIYRFAMLGGSFVMCMFIIFPEEIGEIVYGKSELARYLKTLSFLCPVMFVDSLSTGILNGLGKQMRILTVNILDSVLRMSMIYFLTPHFGVKALIFMIIVSNIFTCGINVNAVLNLAPAHLKIKTAAFSPVLSAGLTFLIISPFARGIIFPLMGIKLGVVLSAVASLFIYLTVNVITKGIEGSDIKQLALMFKRAE